ncbi:hypothetical protein BMIN10S_01514 [Bosea minatitlanensis]
MLAILRNPRGPVPAAASAAMLAAPGRAAMSRAEAPETREPTMPAAPQDGASGKRAATR